jgi:hypothetical protein
MLNPLSGASLVRKTGCAFLRDVPIDTCLTA